MRENIKFTKQDFDNFLRRTDDKNQIENFDETFEKDAIDEDTVVTFTDSSWNDCIDTGRSTGRNCSIMQGGSVDHSSHLPIPVAMSSGEAEYISAATACMRAINYECLFMT